MCPREIVKISKLLNCLKKKKGKVLFLNNIIIGGILWNKTWKH